MTTDLPRPAQTIIDRMRVCIDRMVTEGQTPRAIYLTADDYAEAQQLDSEWWTENLGGPTVVWPTEFFGVHLIAEHLIDKIEIPVRQCVGVQRRRSAVYGADGSCILLDLAGSL